MQYRDAERAAEHAMQSAPWRNESASLRATELTHLERDARLAPRNAAIWHRYGLALYTAGRKDEAGEALKKACELEPASVDLLYVLAIYYKDNNRLDEAHEAAQRLVDLAPDDPRMTLLLQEVREAQRQSP
jgi:cytochrome c-type biogenesis protein CcmH/NrfG